MAVCMSGYLWQMLLGTITTLELASLSLVLGMVIGLFGALLESIPQRWLRLLAASLIFFIRGLPEILVLFFIYFGCTALFSQMLGRYVDISPFVAGSVALSLIFGAYASQVFRGAFLAIEAGQIEAAKALGFTPTSLFIRIQLPQAWRHALPGLGNLWLVLLKDTAIVMLIGLTDLLYNAKLAASSTHQPFSFYLAAALIYLMITLVSQKIISILTIKANRYLRP